jgi:tol-pal system protein YbgF
MRKSLFLVLSLSLLLAACAAQKDIQILDSRLDTVEAKSQDIANRVEKANEPVRTKQAEIWAEVQSLRSDLAQAKGEVEVLKRQVAELEQVQNANNRVLAGTAEDTKDLKTALIQANSQLGLNIDLDKIRAERQKVLVPVPPADAGQPAAPAEPGQPAAPAQDQPATQAPPHAAAQPAAPANQPAVSTAAPAAAGDAAEALYNKARDAFEARKYADAQTMWEDFATKHPDHKLTANAVFWQGESYYQLGDYARAILKYQDVIDKYAKSDKYRSAVLKQGMSFIKLGRDKAGKVLLQDLIKKYPDSVEAKRAKSVLGQ